MESTNNMSDNIDENKLVNLDAPDTGFTPNPGEDIRHNLTEGIDKTEFKIDDFQTLIDSKNPNVEKDEKKDKNVKAGENKGDKIPEVPPVKSNEEPNKTGEIEQPDKQPEVKPLGQLNEEEVIRYGKSAVELFPKMAKEAREFLKARIDHASELEGKLKLVEEKVKSGYGNLPESYLDHPEAYSLDPKFKEYSGNLQLLRSEADMWLGLLEDCRNGDKVNIPVGRDNQGQLIYKEYEASKEVARHLSSMVNTANLRINKNEQLLEGLQTSFKQSHEKQRKDLGDLADYYFPAYTGDKGKSNRFIKVMDDIVKARGQENNMLAPFVSRLYAFAMEQTEFIKANQSKWDTKPKPVVQPNSGDINNAGGDKKVVTDINKKVFDANEYAKEMGQ